MNNAFNKKRATYRVLLILIFSVFGLYAYCFLKTSEKWYETNTYFISSVLFIIIFLYLNKGRLEYYLRFWINRYIGAIILLSYIFYVLILTLLLKPGEIIHTTTKVTPIILFLIIYPYFFRSKKRNEIIHFICILFIGISILALILYFLGYCALDLNIGEGIKFISKADSIDLFEESRLYFISSHKSRFAAYCSLGIVFIYKDKLLNNYLKFFSISIILIDIVLSKSMTFLGLIFIFSSLYFYNMNKEKRIEKNRTITKNRMTKRKHGVKIILLSIILIISACFLLGYLSKKRSIMTVGSRTYIWKAAVKQIEEYPEGIIKMPNSLWLKSEKFLSYETYFGNGHNIILNSAIEFGIIGGVLYSLIFLYILVKLKQKKQKLFLYVLYIIILSSMIDDVIAREMMYMFFISFSMFLGDIENKKLDINSKDIKNKNHEISNLKEKF